MIFHPFCSPASPWWLVRVHRAMQGAVFSAHTRRIPFSIRVRLQSFTSTSTRCRLSSRRHSTLHPPCLCLKSPGSPASSWMHTPWGPAPSQRCSPRLLQAHRALSRARSTLQAQHDGSNIAQCPGCTRHGLGLHAGLVGGGQDHLNSGAVALRRLRPSMTPGSTSHRERSWPVTGQLNRYQKGRGGWKNGE